MADLMDAVIGCIGVVGMCTLLVLSGYEMGEAQGKREAVSGFECPPGTMFQIVRHDTGETKCILPRRKA